MKPDPAIDAIREVRRQISEAVGHDARRLVQHYRKLQERHCEVLADHSTDGRANGREGGEVRPKRPTQGKVKPGITSKTARKKVRKTIVAMGTWCCNNRHKPVEWQYTILAGSSTMSNSLSGSKVMRQRCVITLLAEKFRDSYLVLFPR